MTKNYPLPQIQEALQTSQRILIFLSKSASFDQVAAGLSLFLSLGKTGKQVSIVSPEPMTVDFSHLVGLNEIQTELPGGDLIMTLNYPVENIEKVFTTNEPSGSLQIVVKVKPEKEPVKKEEISFSAPGMTPQLVWTIGVHKPEGLGKIYQEKKEILQGTVVNLDNSSQNVSFGKINIIDTAASLSEMMVAILTQMHLPFEVDIAANLLLGLKRATDSFQAPEVSADTFEAASIAMKAQKRLEGPVEITPSLGKPPAEWLEPKIYKGSTLP